MYNGAIRANQKIAVCEHSGGIDEVHRLGHSFLPVYKMEVTVASELFAACPLLNGDELDIGELAEGLQALEGKRSPPRVEGVLMFWVSLPVKGDEFLSWLALQ